MASQRLHVEETLALFRSASAWELVEHESRRWLDDMMSDAQDPGAPQELREKARAIRGYLEMGNNDSLTQLNHREFASRFERYLVANTAPTKTIALVFAEFRAWLITIHGIAEQSGIPAAIDIQDWYTRILSLSDPEKTVIAPDRISIVRPTPSPASETCALSTTDLAHDRGQTFWPIYIYFAVSVAIAASAVINAGWSAGFYAIATCLLFLIAGGGLKVSLWWGDKVQKIGGAIVAAFLVALAQWLSNGFSIQIADHLLSGATWGWVGFVICFVFASKELAN